MRGIAIVLVIAVAAVASSAGSAAVNAKAHNQSCSQLLSPSKLNEAFYGKAQPPVGKFSGAKVYKTREWYYPYNKAESQAGSQCFYLWTLAQAPADYQALFAPPGPTVSGGANMVVGFNLSVKKFDKGRTEAEQDGTGEPGAFTQGHVRKISFGHAAKAAYLEDAYGGTGPTYNDLALYVLTRRNNYFAIYAWDASLAQLENIAKTVLTENF